MSANSYTPSTASSARHKYTGQGDTQEDRILAILKRSAPAWVPAPELAKICLQYCRAIAGLRKDGYVIDNRVEQVGRVRHGYYRFGSATATMSSRLVSSGSTTPFGGTVPLFAEPLARRMD